MLSPEPTETEIGDANTVVTRLFAPYLFVSSWRRRAQECIWYYTRTRPWITSTAGCTKYFYTITLGYSAAPLHATARAYLRL